MKKLTVFLTSLFLLTFTGIASSEYIDNGDGTITDTSASLMWQKTYGQGNWDTANSYCTQAGTGGYSDWRLPALTELQLLVDHGHYPTIDPIFSCEGWLYWTSTAAEDSAWVVNFSNGSAGMVPKSGSSNIYVRCVRVGTIPTNCVTVGSDLSLHIPCLLFNGVLYEVELEFYSDPLLPGGLYWRFKSMKAK